MIRWFCTSQIEVIMNFAVITKAVIKRVHCSRVTTFLTIIVQAAMEISVL